MDRNPVLDFAIDKASIRFVGEGLQRPECILAEPDGTLWAADARGGVASINPDGTQQIVTQRRSPSFAGAENEAARYLTGTLPMVSRSPGTARSSSRTSAPIAWRP